MRRFRRLVSLVMVWALATSTAGAYYHYVHFLSVTPPFLPVVEKFDLSVLPNKTVTFFVSDIGPAQYVPNDSFPSVLSQMRQAARAWNGVAASDLRVAFGGLITLDTPQAAPGGEIVFDDEFPPGLLAFSTHTTAATPVTGPDGGLFFPITRAIVHMHRDLTQLPGPSFSEGFFLTVVHEMGHALGLQHTFTSSVMSQAVTRATSLVRPLDVDDMAAISLLYPRNLPVLTGSITGTVTLGGVGVNLASVVALRANGGAVSTLTNPDGTYRIAGIPPGQYLLYVHALPPSANIIDPVDADGKSIPPGPPFGAAFFPNALNPQEAVPVTVTAGASADGRNFNVQPRDSLLISEITTYSFFGNNAVHPAYLDTTSGIGTFVVSGNGLGANGVAAPDLALQVLGGAAIVRPGGLRGYGAPATYVAADLQFGLAGTRGPQHLVFSRGDNLYVLPSGLDLENGQPPLVSSIAPTVDANGNTVLAIGGANFTGATQIYFDGLPGVTRVVDAQNALVTPPPGASGQNATLNAFNPDGQNSMFFQAGAAPTYQYGSSEPPSVRFSPAALPAGAEAMVEIDGVNTSFADGQTIIGFGSSDIFVRRLWVLSPTRALANVAVSPLAPAGPTLASALSGFQVFSQAGAFQILAFNPLLPVVNPQLTDAIWAPSGIYPGAFVSLSGSNLGGAAARITINGEQAAILAATDSRITLVIPAGLSAGPAVLRLNNGARDAFPVVIDIGAVPPAIWAVQNASAVNVDAAHPAHPGDIVTLAVFALSTTDIVDPSLVHIFFGAVEQLATSVSKPFSGIYLVQFTVSAAAAAGDAQPMTVSIDGRTSLPLYLPIH